MSDPSGQRCLGPSAHTASPPLHPLRVESEMIRCLSDVISILCVEQMNKQNKTETNPVVIESKLMVAKEEEGEGNG